MNAVKVQQKNKEIVFIYFFEEMQNGASSFYGFFFAY